MSSPQTIPSARHARTDARTRTTSPQVGYAVAVAVDAVMLLLVNRSPGWEAVPFLTDRTAEVIPLVNASLVVGIVVNVLYLVGDPVWLRAAGDVVTTGVGLAALVRIWQVWPVDLTSGWEVLARVLVGLGVVGSMIGILTALVQLTRWFAGSPSSPRDSHPANATTRHA